MRDSRESIVSYPHVSHKLWVSVPRMRPRARCLDPRAVRKDAGATSSFLAALARAVDVRSPDALKAGSCGQSVILRSCASASGAPCSRPVTVSSPPGVSRAR